MTKKTIDTELKNALEGDPSFYLKELVQRLTEARKMVWTIVETKRFAGFEDAQNLVKSYDYLNKTLSIFQSYQLPLPVDKEKQTDPGSNATLSMLPEVGR